VHQPPHSVAPGMNISGRPCLLCTGCCAELLSGRCGSGVLGRVWLAPVFWASSLTWRRGRAKGREAGCPLQGLTWSGRKALSAGARSEDGEQYESKPGSIVGAVDVVGVLRTRRVNIMFWYGNGVSGWGYGLMGLGMVVFWALVIVLVVSVSRHNRSHHDYLGSRPVSLTADQLLAERFARGEIDQQEYSAGQAALRDHVR
jgi:putative membrane protein